VIKLAVGIPKNKAKLRKNTFLSKLRKNTSLSKQKRTNTI
jgi:hypothetical protein